MPTIDCPSRIELDSFQAGNLDEPRLSSLESHVEGCETCQKALETVIGESADSVLSALLEDAEPDTFATEASCRTAVERVTALARELSAGGTEATIASAANGNEAANGSLPVESIREYKLLAKLGEGGMGAVYKALQTRLDKVVALKVLPAERMRDTGAVARFQREMKAVGKLDHPNIVRAMDAGEEAGMHFLVMEYVEGLDLSQLAKLTGPLPIADACELVRQAALGLAEAHEHGMVHRDIKPSNLILAKPRKKSGQPTVKILDLGLALLSEALASDAGGLTTSGQMMGTIDYMAPEQGGDSHQVDIRADIYSLGATLYKLLTGVAPFAGEKFDTPVKKLMALATQSPNSIRSLRPDVPAPLAQIIERMLAKNPADRFATPEELIDAIAQFSKNSNLAELSRRAHVASITRGEAASPLSPGGRGVGGEGEGAVETGTHARSSPSGDTAPTIDHVAALPLPLGEGRGEGASSPLSPPGRGAGGQGQAGAKREPRPLVAALGGRKIPRSFAIACGGLTLAVLLGIIFFIQTPDGTVRIEITDPQIKVVIDNDGQATFTGADKKHKIVLQPGPHGITITRGDLTFGTTSFELKKGDKPRLKIEYIAGKVLVTKDGTALPVTPLRNVAKTGARTPASSVADYALEFNGEDSFVEVPTLKFAHENAATIEALVTPYDDSGYGRIALWHGSSKYFLLDQDSRTWIGCVNSQGSAVTLKTAAPVGEFRKPVHLAVVVDRGNLSLFIDGKQGHRSPDRRASIAKNVKGLLIGRYPRGDIAGLPFHGRIDEMRISSTARYKDDYAPKAGLSADADTLALYHFDEGTGDVLNDSSGNNHHGKIVGAKWVIAERIASIAHSAPSPAARVTPPATQNTSPQTVDLLKLVDVSRDAMKGTWTLTADGLASDGTVPFCRLKLPYVPPPEYDFRIDFTAQGGNDILQLLTAGGHDFTWLMGAWGGKFDGFDTVKGHPLGREGTNIIGGPTSLRRGQRHTSVIQVRRDFIAALIDGKEVVRHATDGSDLGIPAEWSIGDGSIGLGTTFDAVTFHKIELVIPPSSKPTAGWQGWPADAPPPAIAPFDADQAKRHQEGWAKYLGVPVEWENSIGMKFVLIPPGEFQMGSTPEEINDALRAEGQNHAWDALIQSQGPQHQVILTQPFYLGVCEVTQANYHAVRGQNPSYFAAQGAGKDAVAGLDTANHPVESIQISDTEDFCTILTRDEFSIHNATNGYRLPTAAEWEFASRAGTMSKYFSGDSSADAAEVGWFRDNSQRRTHPVGGWRCNSFGLFDTVGNVWEWVQDRWQRDHYKQFAEKPAIDPVARRVTPTREARGGSWDNSATRCQSSFRGCSDIAQISTGFRVALNVSAVKSAIAAKASAAGWHGWPADAPPPAIAPFDAAQAKAHQDAWAEYLGVPVEWENSLGMKFRLIPPGEFTMGATQAEIDEGLETVKSDKNYDPSRIRASGPPHLVILMQPMYLAAQEVTQSQYEAIMGTNPSAYAATGGFPEKVALVEGLDTSGHPVDGVSWNDAAEFCAKLSQREKLSPRYFRAGDAVTALQGNGYRLPSEATWEFACRAGTAGRYWSGEREDDLTRVAWYGKNSGQRTHSGGELPPNSFGLFDIHGNVMEWCQDWWEPEYYRQFGNEAASDPTGPTSGTQRTARGGGWGNFDCICRSATRHHIEPTHRSAIIGFRVALSLEAVRESIGSGDSALEFNGKDSYVELSTLKYDGSHPITIEAWATPLASREKGYSFVVENVDDTFVNDQYWPAGIGLQQRAPADGAPNCFGAWVSTKAPPSGQNQIVGSQKQWSIGRPAHLALQLNDGRAQFYIDGILVEDRQLDESHRASGKPFVIGKRFGGQIREVRVSKIARYAGDFAPQNRAAADEHTLALYHFDEGTGTELNDSSGNNHHGKIVGAKWVRFDPVPSTESQTQNAIEPLNIPEPPPLAEWLKGRTILTVAQDGSGQFKSIQAALDALRPGQVVKVLDAGPYYERLTLESPPADSGLISDASCVIELKELKRAGWKSSDGVDVYDGHLIKDANEYRISGIHFVFPKAGDLVKSPGGFVCGGCRFERPNGVVLENCRFEGRCDAPNWDSVTLNFLENGGLQPCVIRECLIEGGLRLDSRDSPASVVVTRNYLVKITQNPRPGLKLFGSGYDRVAIRQNILDGAPGGYDLALANNDRIGILEISNNVLTSRRPILVRQSAPAGRVVIQNNLCTKPGIIELHEVTREQADQAFRTWQLGHNCYPRLLAEGDVQTPFPEGEGDVPAQLTFLSYEPTHPDYLRLPVESPLQRAGASGAWPSYIGALPPGPAPKDGDWFTRLRGRWRASADP